MFSQRKGSLSIFELDNKPSGHIFAATGGQRDNFTVMQEHDICSFSIHRIAKGLCPLAKCEQAVKAANEKEAEDEYLTTYVTSVYKYGVV